MRSPQQSERSPVYNKLCYTDWPVGIARTAWPHPQTCFSSNNSLTLPKVRLLADSWLLSLNECGSFNSRRSSLVCASKMKAAVVVFLFVFCSVECKYLPPYLIKARYLSSNVLWLGRHISIYLLRYHKSQCNQTNQTYYWTTDHQALFLLFPNIIAIYIFCWW